MISAASGSPLKGGVLAARHGRDDAGRGVHAPDALVPKVGNVEITFLVYREP